MLRQQQVKHAWVGAFKITAARASSSREGSPRVVPSEMLPANSSAAPQHRPKPSASMKRIQQELGRDKKPLGSIWSGRMPNLNRRSPIAAAVAAVYGTTACAESETARPPVHGDQRAHSPPLSSVILAASTELRATSLTATTTEFDDLVCTAELGEQ